MKKGRLGIYKVTPGESDGITDLQVFINLLASTSGTFEGDATGKTYSSQEIVAGGDNRKVAIGKLDAQADTNRTNINANGVLINNNTITTYANELIAAAGAITKSDNVYKQVRRISGDAAAVTASTTPFGSSLSTSDGVSIVLRGTHATNTVKVTNNDIQYGAILNGDATLGIYMELELMYDSVLERWLEQRRNF